jgi:WD40 repeat protein
MTFASFDAAGHGLLFELEHGTIVTKFEGHTGIVAALDFTPDSKRIATGAYDGTVRIWSSPPTKAAPPERKR